VVTAFCRGCIEKKVIMMTQRTRWFAMLLIASSVPAIAHGAVGFRQLTATFPAAVQRGASTEIKVRANFTLDGTHTVLFDQPGIEMTYAEKEAVVAPLTGRGSIGTPHRFRIQVPKDQPPRVYEFRTASNQAVSSVGMLLVTDFPVVTEKYEENNTTETADAVTLPVAYCGVCEASEDVDCMRFTGRAGDEIVAQVYAQRVTSAIHDMVKKGNMYLMDPILTVFGPSGQIVAQNDNYFGGDSMLACKLPEDGQYTVEVRDVRYAGDKRYTYCVEVSNQPLAQVAFPMAVERGKTAQATLVGPFCDELAEVTLDATKQKATGWTRMRLGPAGKKTNYLPLLISDCVEATAPADNTDRAKPMKLKLPQGVSARLAKPGQAHHYAFEGVKDQFYRFEIDSHRRGLPLDSLIEIYDAKGKKVAEGDDAPFTKDAQLYFKAPETGTYTVEVRDLHGRGGPEFVYHLCAEPSGPDFELLGEWYYAMLGPGTNMLWFARINRLNGFDGPVSLEVNGLPEGVTATPVSIPAGSSHCGVILSAAKDAKIGATLVHVVGRAEVKDAQGKTHTIERVGRATCELQSGGGSQARWPSATQIVGVVDPMDLLSVKATPAELTLTPGGKGEIKVRIERNKDFSDAVTLDMAHVYFNSKLGEQLPPGVTMGKGSQLRLSGKTLEGKIILEAASSAPPIERYPVAAMAAVSISFSINTKYASNPVFVTVLKPGQKAKKGDLARSKD
jgi:hypothetical protein